MYKEDIESDLVTPGQDLPVFPAALIPAQSNVVVLHGKLQGVEIFGCKYFWIHCVIRSIL